MAGLESMQRLYECMSAVSQVSLTRIASSIAFIMFPLISLLISLNACH